jgi:hypothetical protein
MTQAFNLSQLANNLNTAGQLDATDGLTGAVPVANGGTGQTTYSNGQLLIGNGSGLTKANITAGSGISVTNGSGTITIATSGGGVTSLNGQTGAITNTNYGSIGSYFFNFSVLDVSIGGTVAGSSLDYSAGGVNTNAGLSGTWRMMGGQSTAGFTFRQIYVRVS